MRNTRVNQILTLLLFCFSMALGQAGLGPEYIKNLPTVEKVMQDVQGVDELDTKAKQCAAFERLFDFICFTADQRPKKKNEGINILLTNEEKKFNAIYSKASTKIILEVYDELDPWKTERFRNGSPCDLWRIKKDEYLIDRAFIRGLLKEYVSLKFTEKYCGEKTVDIYEYHNSKEYETLIKKQEQDKKRYTQKINRSESFKSSFFKKLAQFGTLAIFFLLLLPLLNYFGNRSFELSKNKIISGRNIYNIYSVTGLIAQASKTSTTHVYTTGGEYNSATKSYSPTTMHSTSTIHDQFFLTDKYGKEHPIQLSGWDLPVRQGNSVTMIWAVKEGKERGPYLMAINHTTDLKYTMEKVVRKMFSPVWNWLFTLTLIALIIMPVKTEEYLQLYICAWVFHIIGYCINWLVVASIANKRTKAFTNYFNGSDYN